MAADLEEIPQTDEKPTACLIFLHGATRNGQHEKNKFIKLLGDKASFKHIKIIFPTSPRKHFSLFGKVTNIWFNAEEDNGQMKTSLAEIDEVAGSLKDIIEQQKESGISSNRIIIGGESQGGMISLHTAFRFCPDLAGCIAVSACLPEQHIVYQAAKESENKPSLLMLHSTKDEIIPFRWGQLACERLQAVGVNGEFHEMPDGAHELSLEELEIIYKWIETKLPEE